MSGKELETFQLRAVRNNEDYACFEFIYSNGLQSNSGSDKAMKEHLIKPEHISRIDIHYYTGGGTNELMALRLCDKDNNTILECGMWKANYTTHTIVINADERLVGVRSKTWKNGNKKMGAHYDIEFLVCKYK